MSSNLERILQCDEPLDADERAALLDWRKALCSDIAVFGPAHGDTQRLRQVERRLGLRDTPND